MKRRNGETRNGKRQRRGNRHGTLFHKGDRWYIKWSERDPITHKRKRVVESTGESDLEKAREVLTRRAAELGFGNRDNAAHVNALLAANRNIENERERIERERKATAERERKAIADAEAIERDKRSVTFDCAFVYYRQSKKRPDSGDRTLAGYETQYQIFAEWIKQHHPEIEKIRDLTPEIAEQFIDSIEQSRSRSTRNKYLIFLRAMWRVLRWCPDAQLSIDPWEGITTLATKADEVTHKDFSIEQLISIGKVFADDQPVSGHRLSNVFMVGDTDIKDELRVLFAIGIFTGQRLGDCATLKWEDIDMIGKRITFRPAKTWRKYKREVVTHLHPCLYTILGEYADGGDTTGHVLKTVADIYQNREPSMITNRIQSIIRAAGIETRASDSGNGTATRIKYGFHSLRHFFDSYLKNHGVNDSIVNYMLCHEQGKVTARYFHDNATAIENAVKMIPAIPQFTKSGDTLEITNTTTVTRQSPDMKRVATAIKKLGDILSDMNTIERDSAITLIKSTLKI